jgi:hypothetical protein
MLEWLNFLKEIANERLLDSKEAEFLLVKFPKPGFIEDDLKVANNKNCSTQLVSLYNKRIYEKFSISGNSRGKQERLNNLLLELFNKKKEAPNFVSGSNVDYLWQSLLNIAEYTEDKIGLFPPSQNTEYRKLGKKGKKYLRQISIDDDVSIIIQPEKKGYLILLQRDTLGEIDCLAPSQWMRNNRIESNENIIPENGYLNPDISGKNELCAIITSYMPQFTWLKNIETDGLIVKAQDLKQLLEHIDSSNNILEIFYTNFLVVDK